MNTMARVARAYAERTGKENLEVADKARRCSCCPDRFHMPASLCFACIVVAVLGLW